MNISDILSLERIDCNCSGASKKAALEALSGLISTSDSELAQLDVFDSLLARERLGSTGLGHGVALPHGRLDENGKTLGAFIRLTRGIDYDAPDQKPVDILFALLVPKDSTDEQLQILSKLAEKFSDPALLENLRSYSSPDQVLSLLSD